MNTEKNKNTPDKSNPKPSKRTWTKPQLTEEDFRNTEQTQPPGMPSAPSQS